MISPLLLNVPDQLIEAHPHHHHVTLESVASETLPVAAGGSKMLPAFSGRRFGEGDHLKAPRRIEFQNIFGSF
ncbi:MAG TPA: hypothetical protein VGJ20_38375 [Xanthobacteraceae bacterium]